MWNHRDVGCKGQPPKTGSLLILLSFLTQVLIGHIMILARREMWLGMAWKGAWHGIINEEKIRDGEKIKERENVRDGGENKGRGEKIMNEKGWGKE